MRRLLLGALLGLFLLGSLALSGCGSTQQAASSSDAPFATIHDALGRDVIPQGLPVVLVEAQAAGLPCFVADTVDPGAAFAGNIHYLPLQNEAAWADSIAAADLTRDPNAQAKAIAAGFDVHTSAGILQKFYLEQTQKYTKEVQP